MARSVVLITGALSGIGRATALEFASQGANLVVSGRQKDLGTSFVAELKSKGVEAEFVKADVRHEDEVKNLIDAIIARFGRLDIAVNNAGKEGLGPLTGVTAESYAALFDTNVFGTLMCLKHEFRVMEKQGKGSIVNVSSIYGHVGFAHGGAEYVASKHAIEGLTRAAGMEGAKLNIRVNAVAPGPIETPMLGRVTGHNDEVKKMMLSQIPAGRAGLAEEVASTIAFIASEKSAYMTGEIITIDGGFAAG